MKKFMTENFKYILFSVIGLIVVYCMIYLLTPKPQMSELDKYKLEQIDNDIKKIIENQTKLDKKISEYNTEISKIDSVIATVQNKKETIKEYYKELGDDIRTMTPSQINNEFKNRYKY
jgi:peptidoglycan hydrolase CwlO-like protein